MIRLILDAQKKQIRIEDTEAITSRGEQMAHYPADCYGLCYVSNVGENSMVRVDLDDVDFEGFVIALTDDKGNQWSSEVIL